MAAVLALVFLFVVASVALFIKVIVGGATFASVFAGGMFAVMAAAVFVALFKMARTWEAEAGPEH